MGDIIVLRYIVTVTEDLIMVAAIVTMIAALCKLAFGFKGVRFIKAGVLAGILASLAMAYAKNKTSKIATNQWNFYIFIGTIALTLLFFVFSIAFGRKHRVLSYYGSDLGQSIGIGGIIVGVLSSALTAILLFYEAPDVLAYPFKFETAGNGILSAEWALRLAGYLLALLLIAVYVRLLYVCALRLNSTYAVIWVSNAMLLFNAVRCFGLAVSKWTARSRWLKWLPAYSRTRAPWAFPLAKFTTNHTLLFVILITAFSLLIPAALFIRDLRVHSPYSNSAQLRRLKAEGRKSRRNAIGVLACFMLILINLTLIQSYLNRPVELSQPEPYTLEDNKVYIAIEQINDGHLHRFEYTTENNIGVRWIIVKKPGAGAYGVGLDACDVCGNAGYYERGEQIVCKRCDVVMNINTIGFKGGCNPIPLEYSVADGNIIIPLPAVLAGEKEFK